MDPGSAPGQRSPAPWAIAEREQKQFFEAISQARQPLLVCDYDGTLAPFQVDKMQAYPYPGVPERLARIVEGGSELAFLSGRPAGEIIQLLPLAAECQIWGMHGREHRSARGRHTVLEPKPEQRAALDAAGEALVRRGWEPSLLERKVGSLAMHWRTLVPEGGQGRQRTQEQARADAEEVFREHAGLHAMAALPFDGGLELRTEDRTKAHAVEALLGSAERESIQAGAAVFLGDDLTDEDGFLATAARGVMGLLVRGEPRRSHAPYFLRPPAELLAFLDAWIGARSAGRDPAGSQAKGRVL